MIIVRQNQPKVSVYPKDPQKVDKRGFYIHINYGQKQRLDKVSKKPLFKDDGKPLMTTDKEEKYYSDYLYFPNPKNDSERRHNKHVYEILLQEAESYRVRIREGRWKRGGGDASKTYLMDYLLNKWLPKQDYKKATISGYNTVYKRFLEFSGRDILVSQLDSKICVDFFNYLKTSGTIKGKLSDSASKKYMKTFKFYLEKIFNRILIDGNSPAKGITVGTAKSIKTKEFLERHELNLLEETATEYEELKAAYLFASFSAITKAELLNLKWGDFNHIKEEDRWFVNVVRQKTQKSARLELSPKAMSIILPNGKHSDKVFPNLKRWSYADVLLKSLILDAGINKKITFHTAKNNFAIMFWRKHKHNYIGDLMVRMQHTKITTTQRYLQGVLGSEYSTVGVTDF